MNGKLLDTNVLVRLFNGDKKITDYLSKQNDIRLSSISLGELLFGTEKSRRTEENKNKAIAFFSRYNLYETSEEVAAEYGKIKFALLKTGNPIPENDLWLAAVAKANDFAIVTQDKHFKKIADLSIIEI